MEIITNLNIAQLIAGSLIGNTDRLIKDIITIRKNTRATTREKRFDLLKSSYNEDKKSFIIIHNKHQDLDEIRKYDCLLLNEIYPFTIYDEDMKTKRKITSLSTNIFKQVISFNKDNFRELQIYGCHNYKKWIPLGMHVIGKPEIIYTKLPLGQGKNAKPTILSTLELKTPITLICNPHCKDISFLNLYEILNPILASSSKNKEDNDYMLYSLGIPLFDIIKEHQTAQEELSIQRTYSSTSSIQSTSNRRASQISMSYKRLVKSFSRLHPYRVKSGLIKYYHNKREQVKVLEIYSGNKCDEENNYKGFSGVIRVYFAKTEGRINNTFADAVDTYVETLDREIKVTSTGLEESYLFPHDPKDINKKKEKKKESNERFKERFKEEMKYIDEEPLDV